MKKQKKVNKSLEIKSYNTNTLKKAEEFLVAYERSACNVSVACKAIDIERCTFYDWKKKYPKFRKAVEDIEQGIIDMAESQLAINIRNGKETSLFFFLCNRAKARWKNIQQIQHTGSDGEAIKFVIEDLKNDTKGSKGNKRIPQK